MWGQLLDFFLMGGGDALQLFTYDWRRAAAQLFQVKLGTAWQTDAAPQEFSSVLGVVLGVYPIKEKENDPH